MSSPLPSSFRDPNGFLFIKDQILYRNINNSYKNNYELLMSSGLYNDLEQRKLIVSHEELPKEFKEDAYKVIKPFKIPFISYPYEWCFSALKDAALLTLEIQEVALKHNMSLKDASAYNIQFQQSSPIFIDTLSFEEYKNGQPWVAYKQFCQHFLAPLVLASKVDFRLISFLKNYVDGIPLDLASFLLPASTKLNPGILFHIHLHSKLQGVSNSISTIKANNKMSLNEMLGLIDNLKVLVTSLNLPKKNSEWGNYYEKNNYVTESFNHKKEIISTWLDDLKLNNVWDFGSNTGAFSEIAVQHNLYTVSFDKDFFTIESNYSANKNKKATNLPLVLDLTNPSPDLGWANNERDSLLKRGPCDMAFALALIHHLAIGNNLPFKKIAEFFSSISDYLIIEFINKSDSQVQKLLSSREDVFNNYNQELFENAFREFFEIQKSIKIINSERTLYLLKRK